MKSVFESIVNTIDNSLTDYYLKSFNEKNSLMTFLFHGLFRSEEEISTHIVDPMQGITISHFKQFIEHFLGNGYSFISPTDILGGLKADKKYGLITFDDGYYNNLNALPILKDYRIPAVFFVSINHVKENKCFWWDIIYRERLMQGLSKEKIFFEQMSLKNRTNDQIEEYIHNSFGQKVFTPISDIDRPFTLQELKSFSLQDGIFIGNHTANHAILTNYDLSGVKDEIGNSQDDIFHITGKRPIIISYPNGNYSNDIIKIANNLGLKIGVTVEAGKNPLPLKNMMRLGRYCLVGKNNIESQCKVFRSDLKIKDNLLKIKRIFV